MTTLAEPRSLAAVRGETFDPTDLRLAIALEAASDIVRRYCGRTFDYVADDEVQIPGSGSRSLMLPELPVHEVSEISSVYPNFDTPSETVTNLVEAGYYAVTPAGCVDLLFDHLTWDPGAAHFLVTYTHGYRLPGDAGDGPRLPADLELAVLNIASRIRSNMSGDASSEGAVVRQRTQTFEVEYAAASEAAAGTSAVLGDDVDTLDLYRLQRLV